MLALPIIQAPSILVKTDDLGVVHTYGDPEESGTIGISRSDGTTVIYSYEAKPTCVKFEDADPQLGEDETVGLTDTFIITFYGGALPVSGEIKSGAGTEYFTINSVGDIVDIYYYDTLTYKITLVSLTNNENTFTFTVESINKPGNTALSHVDFCFSERTLYPDIEIVKKVWKGGSWVDSGSFTIGDNVQFKITVTNTGDVDLDSYVLVTDDLPGFLTYNYDASIPPSSTGDYHIEWEIGSLSIGETKDIIFSANANAVGNGDNIASVEGKHNCLPPVSDSDTVHILVEEQAQPDVEIVKKVWKGGSWVDSASFNVGDDVSFQLTVTNTGNVDLDSYVILEDDLPGFLSYNGDASPPHTSSSSHHIEWNNLAPLGQGDSIIIVFSAHADTSGDANNVASVEAKYDCEPSVSDSDTAHITVTEECEDEPPVTVKEYGQPFYTNGMNDWITTSTLIYLNATDYPIVNPSGVLNTFYRVLKWSGTSWAVEIDWTVYTCPFMIPSECKHKIEFYSVDNCCNQEEIKNQIVHVDDTPPCSWLKVTEDPDHYVSQVSTVTIDAKDGGSCAVGSYTLFCYINGKLYKTAHNNKISFQFNELYGFTEEGRYTIKYWAVDDLGNEETHHSESFILDTTPPDTDYSFDGANRWFTNHWQIEPTTKIILTATDSGSGVDYTKYRQGYDGEGGEWKVYTGPFIPINENIFFYSRDKVGNQETLVHLYVEIVNSIDNKPPNTPGKPSGQNHGNTETSYTYTTSTIDPEGNKIKYYFSWGDGTGEWTEYVSSGNTISLSHIWIQPGMYQVKVKAQDTNGAESAWSQPLEVHITNEDNLPPDKPVKPSGPISGRANIEYSYMITTKDPEGDRLYYLVDWGDGTTSGWVGPYSSGGIINVKHTWINKGVYQVRAKARDYYGAESSWSEPLTVSMSKSRSLLIFEKIKDSLEQCFPWVFKILEMLR
ncbi:MAG: hypothetical protein DRM98_02910 [Thermoplasmata archaeon]|nr:MAG: hypothetical protein DRM98_02910 [Thermoplasmata archaeon]